MGRSLRSPAVLIDRHALPQIALDAGLIAIAHLLAYRLRFDDGFPERYAVLRDHSLVITVAGTLIVFWGFGLYGQSWRNPDRDILARVPLAMFVATLTMVGAIAALDPAFVTTAEGLEGLSPPAGVIGAFFLLALMFTLATRLLRSARPWLRSSVSRDGPHRP